MDESQHNRIMTVLATVIDPELRLDVVSLGFINKINFNQSGLLVVELDSATMGCPISAIIEALVKKALAVLPEVVSVRVEHVWQPQWAINHMSPFARMSLGLY